MIHRDYRKRSPLARPFRKRAERWRRFCVAESGTVGCGDFILRRFQIPVCSSEARGRRILFLSDLHFHAREEELHRLDALKRVIAETGVDLLLVGGDAVGDCCDLPRLPEALRGISSAAGAAFAIPGNWERGKRWLDIATWRDVYSRGGCRLLCNEYAAFAGIGVYGADDLIHGLPFPPPPDLPRAELRILLVHRPDLAVSFDRRELLEQFDLVLCGHTHGGQWRLPGVGALFIPSFYRRRFDRGWFRHVDYDLDMYVNSGFGELSLPGRFNCRREVVLLELL